MGVLDAIRSRKRQDAINRALQGAYEEGSSGTSQYVYEDEGPQGDISREKIVGATPGGLNFKNAVAALYRAGYGTDALALEQSRENNAFANMLKQAQAQKFMRPGGEKGHPSSVREWEYYKSLSDEEKKLFLEVKRNPNILNLGGAMAVRAPGGGIGESYNVTPKPQDMPAFRAEQTRAQEQAKADVTASADVDKKSVKASAMEDYITEAEGMLKDASGSLFGTGLAMGKSAVGISDKSTKANQQLKLISGWMVSNVPRMEGPQSDFDVQNYREMAATVGDSTVPIGDRMAALKTLRTLQSKYTKTPNKGSPPKLQPGKTIEDGHIYMGGDPSKPESWKRLR